MIIEAITYFDCVKRVTHDDTGAACNTWEQTVRGGTGTIAELNNFFSQIMPFPETEFRQYKLLK